MYSWHMNFSVILDMVLNLPLNLQKSTSNILEFSTVETKPLFDVLFKGYITKFLAMVWTNQAEWTKI